MFDFLFFHCFFLKKFTFNVVLQNTLAALWTIYMYINERIETKKWVRILLQLHKWEKIMAWTQGSSRKGEKCIDLGCVLLVELTALIVGHGEREKSLLIFCLVHFIPKRENLVHWSCLDWCCPIELQWEWKCFLYGCCPMWWTFAIYAY